MSLALSHYRYDRQEAVTKSMKKFITDLKFDYFLCIAQGRNSISLLASNKKYAKDFINSRQLN